MSRSLLSAAILAISLSSCTTVKYQSVPLPLPEPLVLDWERIENDLQCVPDQTYEDVVRIDKRLGTLRGIIESTNQYPQSE